MSEKGGKSAKGRKWKAKHDSWGKNKIKKGNNQTKQLLNKGLVGKSM